MPRYSKRSKERLASCDERLQNVFNEVYDQGRLQQPGYVGIVRSNDRSEFGLKFNKTFDL